MWLDLKSIPKTDKIKTVLGKHDNNKLYEMQWTQLFIIQFGWEVLTVNN